MLIFSKDLRATKAPFISEVQCTFIMTTKSTCWILKNRCVDVRWQQNLFIFTITSCLLIEEYDIVKQGELSANSAVSKWVRSACSTQHLAVLSQDISVPSWRWYFHRKLFHFYGFTAWDPGRLLHIVPWVDYQGYRRWIGISASIDIDNHNVEGEIYFTWLFVLSFLK